MITFRTCADCCHMVLSLQVRNISQSQPPLFLQRDYSNVDMLLFLNKVHVNEIQENQMVIDTSDTLIVSNQYYVLVITWTYM